MNKTSGNTAYATKWLQNWIIDDNPLIKLTIALPQIQPESNWLYYIAGGTPAAVVGCSKWPSILHLGTGSHFSTSKHSTIWQSLFSHPEKLVFCALKPFQSWSCATLRQALFKHSMSLQIMNLFWNETAQFWIKMAGVWCYHLSHPHILVASCTASWFDGFWQPTDA